MIFCTWKTGTTILVLFCRWRWSYATASGLWLLYFIVPSGISSSEKRKRNRKWPIYRQTLEDKRCCHFPSFCLSFLSLLAWRREIGTSRSLQCRRCLVPRISRGHFFFRGFLTHHAWRTKWKRNYSQSTTMLSLSKSFRTGELTCRLSTVQMVQEFISWIIDGEVPAQFSLGSLFSGFVLRHFSRTLPFSITIPSGESLISFPDLTLLESWPWGICTQDKGKLLVMLFARKACF